MHLIDKSEVSQEKKDLIIEKIEGDTSVAGVYLYSYGRIVYGLLNRLLGRHRVRYVLVVKFKDNVDALMVPQVKRGITRYATEMLDDRVDIQWR